VVAPAAFEVRAERGGRRLQQRWPGVAVHRDGDRAAGRAREVRRRPRVALRQVTSGFLRFLRDGTMPAWEVPNMLVKYGTIMRAYE
jgi:hypothetical protein